MDKLPSTIGLVLHFRHYEKTASCLKSLYAEGIDRLLLVDNSEDNGASLNLLRTQLRALQAQGMAIEVFEPGRNLGFSAGVNTGLREIRRLFGKVCVLLINNDALLRSGTHYVLRKALTYGVDIAAAEIQNTMDDRIRTVFYHRLTGLLTRHPLPGSFAYHSACCLMIAPQLAADDLFDEDFFFYGDDMELGWRLARSKITACIPEDAAVIHAPSTGSINGSLFYEYHMVRAHWLMAAKLANNRIQYTLFLLGRILILPIRGLLRLVRQRSSVPILGLVMATSDFIRGRCRALTPAPESIASDNEGDSTKSQSPS